MEAIRKFLKSASDWFCDFIGVDKPQRRIVTEGARSWIQDGDNIVVVDREADSIIVTSGGREVYRGSIRQAD